MTANDERAMLAQMPSEWSFSFWKEQYESARDVPSALGLLGAASSLRGLGVHANAANALIIYLMDIADAESIVDARTRALASKALQALHRVLELNSRGYSDSMRDTHVDVVDKALWFTRPRLGLKHLVNQLSGPKEEEKSLRRYLRNICHTIFVGGMKYATHEHMLQVIDILYTTDRLMEYVPGPDSFYDTAQMWRRIGEVLPRLEELARLDLSPGHTETIEEAAFLGSRAAYVVILARTVLPAGQAFYDRHELARSRQNA